MKVKKFFKTVTVFMCAALISLTAFSFVGCGSGSGYTFFKYQAQSSGDNNEYYSVVDFKMKYKDVSDTKDYYYVREIWIKLAGIDPTDKCEKINFKFYSSTTETSKSWSTSYGLSSEASINNVKTNKGVWIKIFSAVTVTNSSRVYFRIATTNHVKVDELIFLDSEGKVVRFDKILTTGAVTKESATIMAPVPATVTEKNNKNAAKMFDSQSKFVKPTESDSSSESSK